MIQKQRPARSEGWPHDDYTESHPAYAVIGASRVTSSPGEALFGSDFRHQNYIVVRIARADLHRGLSSDRISSAGRLPIIELALSEAQWATFLSTLNVGDGVPCTLSFAEGARVPGIEPDTDRRAQFNAEIDERLERAMSAITAAETAVEGSKLGVREKAALKAQIETAIRELRDNTLFVARSFDEHAEKTVERAKIEVAAYVSSTVARAGLAAVAGQPVLQLADGETVRR